MSYFFLISFPECTLLIYVKPTILQTNEITKITGKCMDLVSALLSEVSQTHARKHVLSEVWIPAYNMCTVCLYTASKCDQL